MAAPEPDTSSDAVKAREERVVQQVADHQMVRTSSAAAACIGARLFHASSGAGPHNRWVLISDECFAALLPTPAGVL
jgi:hypothetical protein